MKHTRNGKIARPVVRNPVYRSPFGRVDAALAKNIYSEHEKTQFWLTKMFGPPPDKADNPKCQQPIIRVNPTKSDCRNYEPDP
jgi:hypothetical protein